MLEAGSAAHDIARRYHGISWSVGMTEAGLVCGAGSVLARMTSQGPYCRLALDVDRDSLLAMLSVIAGTPVVAVDVLPHVNAASLYWKRGDKALANLRLVFANLPRLVDQAAVDRLSLAQDILDAGTSPVAFLKALWPDSASTFALRFDPAQTRVPAGQGAGSGRWTSPLQTGSVRGEAYVPPIRVAENDDAPVNSGAVIPRHDEVVHDASAAGPPKPHPSTLLDPLTALPAGDGPGKFAQGSIAAGPTLKPQAAQQNAINEIGAKFGCHTCGTNSPGTSSGNWVGDHQFPTSLVKPGATQRYYPQCAQCSQIQSGLIKALKARKEHRN